MRTGILANSLPAALSIYDELKAIPDCEVFILLCSTDESPSLHFLRHVARLVLKPARWKSLRLILRQKVFLFQHSLDHPGTVAILRKLDLDVGLHKTGIVYRAATIDSFRLGILNPHIGMLPAYRGRNVMEWSLLQGQPVGITVFFVDTGIDTGSRIVLSDEVDISHCKSIQDAKQYLFDLDAVFFRRALQALGSQDFSFGSNDGSGRRYYVMSKLFQGVVQSLIEANN